MAGLWEVVGGVDSGGILVREGQGLKSPAAADRLSTGAVIEQIKLVGDRLHYRLREGPGPATGWVSVKASGKDLVVPRVSSADPANWPVLRRGIADAAPLPSSLKEAGAWLKAEPPNKKVASARIRLVIFDWTGNRGGAGAMNKFTAWEKALGQESPKDTWEVCKVYYPGRSMRMKEANASSAAEIAIAVVEALHKAGPMAGTVLCGFSFGAILAYETAVLLESQGVPLLGLVVVSAEHPHWPGRAKGQGVSGGPTRDMDEPSFEEMLKSKGGTDMILNNPDTKKMYLPVIRADMLLEEDYGASPPAHKPLCCPVVAYRGKSCPLVAQEDVEPWLQCSACGSGETPSRLEELESGLVPIEGTTPWLSDWYLCQGEVSCLTIAQAIAKDFGTSIS